MADEQYIPLSVLRSYSPHPDKLDLTGLTQDEITHGIKSSKLPDYIRYKQYLTDTNEALAQLAEMIIQFAVNLGLDPDQTLDWARKLQQALPQSEFDSWVATLLDGGPSIFMNTLSELQTTYPNGAAGVALVRETDPAKIYVWNGSAWEDFGDYQGILSGEVASDLFINAENLVTNGDFSNGGTGWAARGTGTVANNELTMTKLAVDETEVSLNLSTIKTDKYYVKVDMLTNSNLDSFWMVDTSAPNYRDKVFHSGSGNYETLSTVVTATNSTMQLRILNSPRTGDISTAPVKLKGALVINLTATFGVGNEPTKEQIDNILAKFKNSHFNGTQNLWVSSQIFNRVNNIEYDVKALKKPKANVVDVSVLPAHLNGEFAYNAPSFNQDNLTTYKGHQYAVWWGEDKMPYIGKRKMPNGEWSITNLSSVSNNVNPLAAPVYEDGHNNIVVAVSSDGYIHVAGNHHTHNFRYVRSESPEDISAFRYENYTAHITGVTYPQFFKDRNEKLYLIWRDGSSESGDTYIMHYYDRGDGNYGYFTDKRKLVDGKTDNVHGYLTHVAVDEFNTIHIAGVWRETSQANTNHDIFYFKSSDGTATWKKSNGASQTIPLTKSNCEIVVDTVDLNSGIINQFGLEADVSGYPHVSYFKYDENGNTNLYHLYQRSGGWTNSKITNFDTRLDTDRSTWPALLSRPSVACLGNRVFIIYRVNYGERKNTLRIIEDTPGRDRVDFPILEMDLEAYEPTIDTQLLYSDGKISMLVLNNAERATSTPDGVGGYNHQFAFVLTVDLNQIDDLIYNKVSIPRLEFSGNTTIKLEELVPGVERTFPLNGLPVITEASPTFVRLKVVLDIPEGCTVTSLMKSGEWAKGKLKTIGKSTDISRWCYIDTDGIVWLSAKPDLGGDGSKVNGAAVIESAIFKW